MENDYRVVVSARDAGKIKDLVEINQENALAVSLDVTDKNQVKQAVSQAGARFGVIDVLAARNGFRLSDNSVCNYRLKSAS